MKATKTLLVAAVAAACMAATAYAQNPTARSASGGTNFNARSAGGSTWSGSRPAHSGSWIGQRGGHWGGHHHHWHGARWGFYFGAPILWSSVYWGWPYYGYPYYYPYPTVIYRDIERYPMSYPEGVLEPAPTTDIGPRSEGAPRQGPLYMNYCESAKAYFPKVTSCPEGWKMISPTQ